jgi:hypothetical protein
MARRERIPRAAKKKINYNNNQLSLAADRRAREARTEQTPARLVKKTSTRKPKKLATKPNIKKARTGCVAKPKKPIKKRSNDDKDEKILNHYGSEDSDDEHGEGAPAARKERSPATATTRRPRSPAIRAESLGRSPARKMILTQMLSRWTLPGLSLITPISRRK